MPILSDDIKLLESAVMADTPEGGGAMTGTEVIDGQSNNVFPDISTDDRAGGRFQVRKLFGAAHTSDTDTLLGASFVVLKPPADPLVHVALFETPGWADERADAIDLIERYLVKGPRYACKIMDTHYAGSMLLQLYQVGGANFPSAGDSVALRNADGSEQYVRVIKTTISSSNFNATEGTGVVSFAANVAVCELGQPLDMDVFGPPIGRAVPEAGYAVPYTTTIASGVAFHGVKPLALPATTGDRSVLADGGIYSPLVPAATVEDPLIDIAPLTLRPALSRTAQGMLTLPAQTLTLQPGTVLRLPTAVQPGSLTITRGGTVFTDDGSGTLKQGATVVGTVDHRAKTVTMAPGSPSYGVASTVIAYLPATASGAATSSDALTITSANQGLAFVQAFEPPPAPGTLSVSFMAQGRWYDLVDNGNGKLAGADSSYGTGSINYNSGSVAFTLGAMPDVGSAVIYQWGNAAAAVAVAPADLPVRISATFAVDPRVQPGTLDFTWSRGAANYTASCSAAGVISGDATGTVRAGVVTIAPAVLPDAAFGLAFDRGGNSSASATHSGGGAYQLQLTPVAQGSVQVFINTVPQAGFVFHAHIIASDDGAGVLRSITSGSLGTAVGTVNYSTGAVQINASLSMDVYEIQVPAGIGPGSGGYYEKLVAKAAHTVALQNTSVATLNHSETGAVGVTASGVPAWTLAVPVLGGLELITDALAFSVGNGIYTSQGGSLSLGWDATTGAGTPAGSVASDGTVTITALPTDGNNAITWRNAANDKAPGRVGQGVFRVNSAPIKVGVFQIQAGALVGSANAAGVISGSGWSGTVDYQRGIVRWNRLQGHVGLMPWNTWQVLDPVSADALTYNAVFLQYVPLDGTLLGLETARLPLDGKVPIYRPGGQVVVHNTLTTQLINPLVKGTVYSLGRQRIAAAVVRTLDGTKVPGALYTVDFDNGTITVPVGSDLTGLAQPFTVHHRIEDELMVLGADISGKLDLVAALTHDYPAGNSYVSSKLRKGDLFARSHNFKERTTWAGSWQATADATTQPTASYNRIDYPPAVTNRGAITERWAIIFMSATTVRVVGENVGQVLTGVSINAPIEPLNPQTGVPYFSVPALGWGGGWAVGNVMLFETAACGGTCWVSRAVLMGPPTVDSDAATIAFRSDVDA